MPGKPGRLKPVVCSSVPWLCTPGLADHVVDERDLVDDVAERRDDLAEHLAALAVGLELPHRPEPGAEAVLERLDVLAEVGRLAVALDEFGLEVEEIDVARRRRP